MNDLTTTLAAQMQSAPGHPLPQGILSRFAIHLICLAGIHLQKKELDEQIKTHKPILGFEL
jgi:hypothetical protein